MFLYLSYIFKASEFKTRFLNSMNLISCSGFVKKFQHFVSRTIINFSFTLFNYVWNEILSDVGMIFPFATLEGPILFQ